MKSVKIHSDRLVKLLLVAAMFMLPWINRIHLSTIMFIAAGIILLISNWKTIEWKRIFILPVAFFATYFIFQVLAYVGHPIPMNRAAVDQKSSLLVLPLLWFIAIESIPGIWQKAKRAFIAGVSLACICCFVVAVGGCLNGNTGGFFYHSFAAFTGLTAIYLSLYVAAAILFVTDFMINHQIGKQFAVLILIVLTASLILLSSKMILLLTAVAILISILWHRDIKRNVKYTLLAVIAGIMILITIIPNPVKSRFTKINVAKTKDVFYRTNFTDYNFDGLNLRVLFWRIGIEVAKERNSWLAGNGGKKYHNFTDQKFKDYKMYTGNPDLHDTGYLGYNMHNQYFESFIQFGVLGLLLVVTFILYFAIASIRYNSILLLGLSFIFGGLFLTESVLEMQAGIILFTTTLSSEWKQQQQDK